MTLQIWSVQLEAVFHSSHYRYPTESKILNCLELCIPLDNLMYVDALMLHKKILNMMNKKYLFQKVIFAVFFKTCYSQKMHYTTNIKADVLCMK